MSNATNIIAVTASKQTYCVRLDVGTIAANQVTVARRNADPPAEVLENATRPVEGAAALVFKRDGHQLVDFEL